MALKYSTTARNNRATQLNTDIGASALLRFYSGAVPASVSDPITGILCATLPCNASGFGTVSNGVLTANAITSASAAAAGTITHFRLCRSDGTAVIQGTVGTSGADINLDNTSYNIGQSVQLLSWVLTMAGA